MSAFGAENNDLHRLLCLECGLCCSGVIFEDVRIRPGDDPKQLKQRGLSLRRPTFDAAGETSPRRPGSRHRVMAFSQPCVAFAAGKCKIYDERPHCCREYECLVFKNVSRGNMSRSAGLKLIQEAQQRAEEVRRLLRLLGDTEEHLALAARFRRTGTRMREVGTDEPTAETYGQLTLAMHDLNFLLSDSFHPA